MASLFSWSAAPVVRTDSFRFLAGCKRRLNHGFVVLCLSQLGQVFYLCFCPCFSWMCLFCFCVLLLSVSLSLQLTACKHLSAKWPVSVLSVTLNPATSDGISPAHDWPRRQDRPASYNHWHSAFRATKHSSTLQTNIPGGRTVRHSRRDITLIMIYRRNSHADSLTHAQSQTWR